jgi:hypothetical protein
MILMSDIYLCKVPQMAWEALSRLTSSMFIGNLRSFNYASPVMHRFGIRGSNPGSRKG